MSETGEDKARVAVEVLGGRYLGDAALYVH